MPERTGSRAEGGERRTHPRRPSDAQVLMRLDTTSVAGVAENISDTGLLFFAGSAPRVEVEIVEDGRTRRVFGRLVRVQCLRGNSTGYAVEFDRASEAPEHDAGKQAE
jgi:hypothetical protein